DSTTAYQGAGGVPPAILERFNRFAAHGLKPDLTLFYDLPPEVGLRRARTARGRGDRIEAQDLAYFRRVRARFMGLVRREPRRVKRIAIMGRSPEAVRDRAMRLLEPVLASWESR
ncbi:MAG: dTMP kinase, partial [bacterium]